MEKKRIRRGIFVKFVAVTLINMILLGFVPSQKVMAAAYSKFSIRVNESKVTMFIGKTTWQSIIISYSDVHSETNDKKVEKIRKDLVWTTSNPEVVAFAGVPNHDPDTGETTYETKKQIKGQDLASFLPIKKGTAVVSIYSKLLNQTIKFKVTVKNAEVTSNYEMFYDHNTYEMKLEGNANAVSFSSSNEKVATVNSKTGKVTTLKPGNTTISCNADNGYTYSYKMQVKKRGLNYKKLTAYYFTGMRKGCYTEFPLVAAGVQVKSWSSSNKRVCLVENHGSLGILKTNGTGKCKITCIAKDGTKYVCDLTVVGGTTWSGLGGYTPTLSELKKHGFYNDINAINDYGDVIVAIYDYAKEINFNNGHKKISVHPEDQMRQMMQHRFGDAFSNGGGDYVQATLDNGKKLARIWVEFYYKK